MIYIVITVVTIILIYIFFALRKNKLIYQKSLVDGRTYLVNNLVDKQEAADTLATIRNRLITLVEKLNPEFDFANGLMDKLENVEFMENAALVPDITMTSYSVNKGEKIVFCLRDVTTGKIHDINLLMYVAIHELAHCACKEYGHTKLWESIFGDLLREGIRVGVYKDENYTINPQNYCGLILDERII
jgi:hypothetical protein